MMYCLIFMKGREGKKFRNNFFCEFFFLKRQIDMIDLDVNFVNISTNNDDNNSPLGQNFGKMKKFANSPIITHPIADFSAFKHNCSPISGLQSVYSNVL